MIYVVQDHQLGKYKPTKGDGHLPVLNPLRLPDDILHLLNGV